MKVRPVHVLNSTCYALSPLTSAMHLCQLDFIPLFDMSCPQHQEEEKSRQTYVSQLPRMPLLAASGADKLGLRILNANIAEMQDLDDANRFPFSFH